MAYLGEKGKYLGKRLEIARKEKGYTKSKLAELVGTDYNSILRYEKGTRKPSTTMLLKLADELGVREEWLTSDEAWTEDDPFTKIPGYKDDYYEQYYHPGSHSAEKDMENHMANLTRFIIDNVYKISDDAKQEVYSIIQLELGRIEREEKEALLVEIEKYKKEYNNYYPNRTKPEDINKVVRDVNKKREEYKEEMTLLPTKKGKMPVMRKK